MSTLTRREFLIFSGPAARAICPMMDIAIPDEPLIRAPDDPREWPAFREALHGWRADARARLKYDDGLYRRPELRWTAGCFACGFVMLWDQAFCDHRAARWTADRFLDQAEHDFGGFDALVLWHAYPRIGLDARNQFDFYRDMPGGLPGIRRVVRCLHRRGVRAFLDYNPWDTGTRREQVSDAEALGNLIRATEADGVFLDTLPHGAAGLRERLEAVRHGVALESELALPLERVQDHPLSWAQWFGDSHAPGVLRNKWFERRHMQHQIRRWDRDHSAELHQAWMNGSGVLVWENVFGSWVGWSARDRSILRAMLPIQRRFRELFAGEGWTPLVPTEREGVYASLWEGGGRRLFTLVNRGEHPLEGPLLRVEHRPGETWHDLVAGRRAEWAESGGEALLRGRIGPRGIGAFLAAAPSALGPRFDDFLKSQAALAARAETDTRFPARTAVPARPAAAPKNGRGAVPPGMVPIPGGEVLLRTEFRVRECGFYGSQHDLFTAAGGPALHSTIVFERRAALSPYAMDVTPVTNRQFARFLRESGWRPRHAHRFLQHWVNGAPPPGLEEHPVVWVDLDDARAYARWAGKRLPTEEEWQHAAAGPQKMRYPWGPEMLPGRCNGGETGTTTPVDAFPAGRSPFGCLDMCGNVWEWTESEREDGRTRFAILKGGSHYTARGSDWYFDGGPRPNQHAAKVLLLWPGLDRCATVGFRCAADLP